MKDIKEVKHKGSSRARNHYKRRLLNYIKRLLCLTVEEDQEEYKEIEYLYIFIVGRGTYWDKVITSNEYEYYNNFFMGQIQYRKATREEILRCIKERLLEE